MVEKDSSHIINTFYGNNLLFLNQQYLPIISVSFVLLCSPIGVQLLKFLLNNIISNILANMEKQTARIQNILTLPLTEPMAMAVPPNFSTGPGPAAVSGGQ